MFRKKSLFCFSSSQFEFEYFSLPDEMVNISEKKKSTQKNSKKKKTNVRMKESWKQPQKKVKHNKSQILEANFSAQGPRIFVVDMKAILWGNGEIALTDDLINSSYF